jgi:predicted membrane protein
MDERNDEHREEQPAERQPDDHRQLGRRLSNSPGRLWAGLFMLLVGGILLLDQMGFPLPDWLFSWHILLIAIGLFLGLRHNFRGGAWLILILVGGCFLVQDFYPKVDLRRFIAPCILILIGCVIMFRPKRSWRHQYKDEWRDQWQQQWHQKWEQDWERQRRHWHHWRYHPNRWHPGGPGPGQPNPGNPAGGAGIPGSVPGPDGPTNFGGSPGPGANPTGPTGPDATPGNTWQGNPWWQNPNAPGQSQNPAQGATASQPDPHQSGGPTGGQPDPGTSGGLANGGLANGGPATGPGLGSGGVYTSEDYIDTTSIFGGVHKKVVSKNFRGGDIVTFLGGSEIDLSQAEIYGTARLDVTQVMGGTKIIVPAHWEVRSEVTALFAGFEDKRQQPATINPNKVLIIDGTSIFGGIELKNF